MTPDWTITTIWYLASFFATGSLWYFLGLGNVVGTVCSAFGAAAAVILAIVLQIRNQGGRTSSIPARLLSFVWSYPCAGGHQASWAVKESATLMGDIGTACEKPGLGVAIVTTELALAAFGDAAGGRVDMCIAWAIGQAEHLPPYRMQVVIREPIHYEQVDVKPDFRHTLAFAVILARARKQHDYLASHLQLVLKMQDQDGGWPGDGVTTVSPVFTAFYAIELLHLSILDPNVPGKIKSAIPAARENGIKWLLEHRSADGLWSSSVLRDFKWDRAFTAAWILHRLAFTADVQVDGWRRCLDEATFGMLHQAIDPRTWIGSTEEQRYRVEARIAAAASRVRRINGLSDRSLDAIRVYMGSWTERAQDWVNRLPSDELDVGTAAFLVYAMVSDEHLADLGQTVLKAEETKRRHHVVHSRLAN